MSRDDWFRHTTWSDKIAAQFDAKLKRARLEKSSELMAFSVQQFKWNAAQALIAGARKQMSEAREFAKRALEAASKDHSGFRYHAKLDLVSKEHADALRLLQAYCDS